MFATAAFCLATVSVASAVILVPSETFKAGTRIACVLDEHMDSSKLSYGVKFKLRVVDTTHNGLEGSEIIGYITEVRQPSGLNPTRVGFYLTSIVLRNGKQKSINAYVVSRRVVPINPAAQAQSRQLSPTSGLPYGTVTPGPIAWQMRIGNGPSSVRESQSPNLGGYVYGTGSRPIIVNAGTPVTVELAESLTIP